MPVNRPLRVPQTALTVLVLLSAGVALSLPGTADTDEASLAPRCPDITFVDDIGRACLHDNGLWQVFGPNGEDLGYTHGPDPVPSMIAEPEPIDGAPAHPICTDGTGTPYYGRIIYARAFDDSDDYATKVDGIRARFNSANALLWGTAQKVFATRDYVMHCTGGLVTIDNVALPTPKASAHFGSIVWDLINLGYNDGRVKYWVWYDDPGACGCGGIGHIYGDQRANSNNWNNGNGGVMFGVTFGYMSSLIMMHENGHNLGAVQLGSPNSSGGWHCNDGRDIMCYSDGGSTANYNEIRCPVGGSQWDCLGDDYFNPLPVPGTYLFNHWNLGAKYVRYIQGEDLQLPVP